MQLHMYDPMALLHTALALHSSVPIAHSSISEYVNYFVGNQRNLLPNNMYKKTEASSLLSYLELVKSSEARYAYSNGQGMERNLQN